MNPSSTFDPRRRTLTAALLGVVVGVQGVMSAAALFVGTFRAPWRAEPRSRVDVAPLGAPPYDLTRDDARSLWDGEQISIATCMHQHGFDYRRAAFADVDEYRYAPSEPRDLEALRRDGYGVAGRAGTDGQPPESSLEPDAEPGKFTDALIGPDLPDDSEPRGPGWELAELPGGASMYWYSDSCIARAFRDIYGPIHPHDEIPLALERWRNTLSTTLAADPFYQSARRDWSACMLGRGYTFDDPSAARRLLEGAAAGRELTPEALRVHELAIADADATCDGEVELDARTREARRRATLAVPPIGAGWDSLASELATALERARQAATAQKPNRVASLDAPSAS